MSRIKIAVASDLSGFPLKEALVAHLRSRGDVEVIDRGIPGVEAPKPYFIQAEIIARDVQSGVAERGILCCGTGQGMAIVANKHKGVYACVAETVFDGERASIINNANVLTLGGWLTAPELGRRIVDGWLAMAFTQTMEAKADFLRNSFQGVQDIEKRNFA